MKMQLCGELERAWRNCDVFERVHSLAATGEVFRHVRNRLTFRFELDGEGFFVKLHGGAGWGEIFKNLVQFKLPVLGAANEFHALTRLHQLGIPTLEIAGFAERGWNPAALESFLVTRELHGLVTLEDLTRSWGKEPPDSRLRHRLIRALGRTAGRMHRAGINHRDCYLCHFMTDTADPGAPELLTVVDLHRAQIRSAVPRRYLVKDVAGLYFSSMDCGLSRRDVLRFIRSYAERPLHGELAQRAGFYRAVERAAKKLYRKEFRRNAPELLP